MIIKRPINTEKTNLLQERGLSLYGFEVDMKADRNEVKKEVERIYEVEVEAVRTVIVRGKKKVRYSKKGFIEGKLSNYKKAYVTLKEGFEIDFFKNI